MSLFLHQPPGREAFPGDVFYLPILRLICIYTKYIMEIGH